MPADILVDTTNPAVLDRTVQTFSAVVLQGAAAPEYERYEGHYVVRSLALPGHALAEMIQQQGYAKVVRVLDGLIDEGA